MKIILITMHHLYNNSGGVERVFCNMANTLITKGYEVSCIYFDKIDNGKPFYHIDSKVQLVNAGKKEFKHITFLDRIKVLRFFNKKKRDEERDFIQDEYRGKILESIIAGINPEVIICYDNISTRIIKLNIQTKIPVITMFHRNPTNDLRLASKRTIDALEKSECIQVLLPEYINELKKFVKTKNVICIPNCVPQYITDEQIEENRKNIIIYPARIDRGKRQDKIVEAFSLISKEFPDWYVEFWGDMNYNKKYYREVFNMINSKKLDNRILFKGITNDIFSQLYRAKICAFPSASEGFGLGLAEAMSAMLPVVAFKNTDFANSMVKDGVTGLLCDDNIDDFALKLKKMMSDDKLRRQMGGAAKKDVKKYSEENIWEMWEKEINDIVNNNK